MLCEDYNFRTNIKELIFDYLINQNSGGGGPEIFK